MTLETVLQQIGSYTDQSIETPTGDDLNFKVSLINKRLRRYGETYDFSELKVPFGVVPTVASTATLNLPTNFKKMASPIFVFDGGSSIEYDEIDSRDRFNSTNYDFCILGNEVQGFNILLTKPLSANISLVADIYSFPSSVATLTDTIPISTPEYLVQGVIADILEGRGDSRFQIAQSKADQLLANAIEKENTKKSQSSDNEIKNSYKRKSFRIGRW